MVHFPNIDKNWSIIATRPVNCRKEDKYDEFFSVQGLKGRGICLIHTLATPLKALSALGRLVLSVIAIATITFAVLTLNQHPSDLKQAGANVIDVTVGTVLLPVALFANVIRGVAGALYPKAMIGYNDAGDRYAMEHPLLSGTLVNYYVE